MSNEQASAEQTAEKKRPLTRRQRRSDGSDGMRPFTDPTLSLQPPAPAAAAPSGPNSALKEPAPKPEDGVDLKHPCRGKTEVLDGDRGLVKELAPDGQRRMNIAICGFAGSSRGLVPVNDPTWSVWGLNQLYRHITRADRWFDIHHNWNEELVPGTDYLGWLQGCGMPFYMLKRQANIPTSVTYPLQALIAHFSADYFTSTIAYMLALAIFEIDMMARADLTIWIRKIAKRKLEGLDITDALRACYARYKIGIFGVDLAVGEEYFWQKPCAEYWIGLACGRGIQVLLPPQSALCKQAYRYGYEKEPGSLIKIEDIDSHQAEITKARDEQVKRLWMLEGAIANNDRWKQVVELRSRGATV